MKKVSSSEEVLVLLPAFNEEVTIGSTIKSIKKELAQATILVVDNASTDQTAVFARKEGAIVVLERRQGKGYAVQRGFDYFMRNNFDCCFLIDADDTYGIDNVGVSIQDVLHNGIDMVVGTRKGIETEKSQKSVRQSHFRPGHKFGNWFFVALHRILLGGNIEDVLSGWRVMSRRFIASFPGGSQGFEIESQLNSHAAAIGASISNQEVAYKGRPEGSVSKLNTFRDGFRILRSTIHGFKEDRPLLAFSLLATPWILFTLWLIYLPFKTYFETGLVPNLPRLVTGVGTFLIAVLLWVTGMVIERVRRIRITILLQRYHQHS